MAVCSGCAERDGGIGHGKRRSRTGTGASLPGRSVGRMAGQLQTGRQAGSGRARSRARARLNWVSQGQRWGRCRVRRRAERVSRPAREKNRRLRVLVVTICSPRPMRAVQRARLADHRRHAEIENAIRDLKYGVGLNHMPSGRFAANGACLAVQVMTRKDHDARAGKDSSPRSRGRCLRSVRGNATRRRGYDRRNGPNRSPTRRPRTDHGRNPNPPRRGPG